MKKVVDKTAADKRGLLYRWVFSNWREQVKWLNDVLDVGATCPVCHKPNAVFHRGLGWGTWVVECKYCDELFDED